MRRNTRGPTLSGQKKERRNDERIFSYSEENGY